MSENLGDAVLELRTDSKGFDAGIDKAKGKTDSLTGSMFKAQMAYDLFKQAAKAAVEFLKSSVTEYVAHEKAIKQTEAVLKSTSYAAGMSSKAIVDLSNSLSNLTGIEDDTILEAENLLLTFTKIGKETFPEATEMVLDMSVALKSNTSTMSLMVGKLLQNSSAMGAAKKAGVSFTEEQMALGKQLFETGRVAEYQKMVLAELRVEFGGSARAARDTFGGALSNLENQIGNVKEAFGMYIAAAGRPFVENMAEMSQGLSDFLMSSEGMKQIGDVLKPLTGVLYVAWTMAKNLFDTLGGFASGIFDSLKEGFSTVTGKGNEASTAFDLLGGVLKIVSSGFIITGKVVNLFIQSIADLLNAVFKSVDVLGAFGAALTDPLNAEKWQAVADKGTIALDAFAKFGTGLVNNYADVIKTTLKEIDSFSTDAKSNGEKLAASFTNGVTTMDSALQKLKIGLSDTAEATKTVYERFKEWYDKMNAPLNLTGFQEELKASWNEMAEDSDATAEAVAEKWKKVTDEITANFETARGYLAPIFESIGTALVEQGNAWKNVGKAGVYAIASIIRAIGDQLTAMAAAEFIKAVAAIASVVGAGLAPGYFASSAIMGLGAAAAYTASGALEAWAGSFANGGIMNPGLALVGERGPELVTVGQTSRIYPADETRNMLGGGSQTVHVVINFDGRVLYDGIEKASDDGRLSLNVRSIK
jgi:hypothetical protein